MCVPQTRFLFPPGTIRPCFPSSLAGRCRFVIDSDQWTMAGRDTDHLQPIKSLWKSSTLSLFHPRLMRCKGFHVGFQSPGGWWGLLNSRNMDVCLNDCVEQRPPYCRHTLNVVETRNRDEFVCVFNPSPSPLKDELPVNVWLGKLNYSR